MEDRRLRASAGLGMLGGARLERGMVEDVVRVARRRKGMEEVRWTILAFDFGI